MTPYEFACKVDAEGDWIYALVDYGLSAGEMDDSNPEFKEKVQELQDILRNPLVTALRCDLDDMCAEIIEEHLEQERAEMDGD